MFTRSMLLLAAVLLPLTVHAQLLGGSKALSASPAIAKGPELGTEVLWSTDAVHPGEPARFTLRLSLSEGWHLNAHEPLEEFLIGIDLKLEEKPGISVASVIYPEPEIIKLKISPDKPMAVHQGQFLIGVLLNTTEALAPGDHTLQASLRWQACNDDTCAMPKTSKLEIPLKVVAKDQPVSLQNEEVFAQIKWDAAPPTSSTPSTPSTAPPPNPAPTRDWHALAEQFKIIGSTGYANSADFIQFIHAGKRGEALDQNPFAQRSMWLVILGILFGGLLLNLTPCVLPLIPINIAIIGAGSMAGSKSRGFALGGAYGFGIALVYGALGLLVVLGLSNAFGAINSTLWFNAGIAIFFVLLAFAMFDIIAIDFSRFQAKFGIRKNENGSLGIAFAMGALSALLAGACVAPVVIQTLLFALDLYSKGNVLAVLLPFLLGLGMALPWPFAGAGMSFLPKPGKWMTKVKYVFGVFMLALAGWYAWHAWGILDAQYLVDKEAVTASMHESDAHGWIPSLEQGLAQAKAENKPVLIDFWASWCKNCLVMNQTTLQDPAVLAELEDVVKVKFQAEDPESSPVKEVWEYYGLLGLPTYVFLKPE